MPLPEPRLGLVISYCYLWHHEHRAGREGGRKVRPCIIVLATEKPGTGTTRVRVAAITHRRPDDLSAACELPSAVKRHLGLGLEPAWVILDEINEFVWPGFDLHPVPGPGDSFAYGFVPPRLFAQLLTTLRAVWNAGKGRATPRD